MSKYFTIDYGQVNLKSLILTNDIQLYEKRKAQGNIGVLFEPKVIKDIDLEELPKIYVVGTLGDTQEVCKKEAAVGAKATTNTKISMDYSKLEKVHQESLKLERKRGISAYSSLV